MYRSLIIFKVFLSSFVTSEIGLLEGFFSKPLNKSGNTFENARLYPYRYRNVDDQLLVCQSINCIIHNNNYHWNIQKYCCYYYDPQDREKRSLTDTLYWDSLKSYESKTLWINSEFLDWYQIAKQLSVVVVIFAFFVLLITIGYIFKTCYCNQHKHGHKNIFCNYCDHECNDP